MRVLVFGGRDWKNRKATYAILDQLDDEFHFTACIDGMAPGADELAFDWALSRGVKTERYKTDWEIYAENLPDLAVAFPGGDYTEYMTIRCEAAGMLVKKVSKK